VSRPRFWIENTASCGPKPCRKSPAKGNRQPNCGTSHAPSDDRSRILLSKSQRRVEEQRFVTRTEKVQPPTPCFHRVGTKAQADNAKQPRAKRQETASRNAGRHLAAFIPQHDRRPKRFGVWHALSKASIPTEARASAEMAQRSAAMDPTVPGLPTLSAPKGSGPWESPRVSQPRGHAFIRAHHAVIHQRAVKT